MATIAALAPLGWQEQLNSQVAGERVNGLSLMEISEIGTHLAMNSGWPPALRAAHIALDTLKAADKIKG